ncbi:MAG: DNA internalization-related competence protein ComEC/Rec2 [Candidatus Marinimicrobia bacterium]|nr:DNA internalization-related competence protein ComEC/Rec2 [Candidatus Neomarinimicrobiota bacterium]
MSLQHDLPEFKVETNPNLLMGTVEKIKSKPDGSTQITLNTGVWKFLLYKDSLHCLPGDTLVIHGMINIPKSLRNRGGFDWKAYLHSVGIQGVMYKDARLIEHRQGEWSVPRFFYQIRHHIKTALITQVGEPYGSLAAGLLLGEKSGIKPEMKEKFRRLGIIHILAVSGLHVGFVLMVFTIISKIFVLPPPYRFLFTASGLLFYLGITGGSVSVMRAVTMAILYEYGKYRQKEISPWNIVGFTGFLFLLINPLQLFSLSFQLSFGAVAGILFLLHQYTGLYERWSRLNQWRQYKLFRIVADGIIVSMGAQLGTFLPIAYVFGEIPVWAFAANILVIPLAGFVVITGIISAFINPISPFVSEIYAQTVWGELFIMDRLTAHLQSLPYPQISVTALTLFWLVLIFLILIIIGTVGIPRYKKRLLISFLCLTNVLVWRESLQKENFSVTFIDVGQGDACLIRDNHHNILIDAGNAGFGRDYGKTVILPLLKHEGITEVDLAIMTHPHADHIGGFESVMKNKYIKEIWDTPNHFQSGIYNRIKANAETSVTHYHHPQPGDRYRMGDMVLTMLYPDSTIARMMHNVNNASIVIRLDYKDHSFLFMGDAEIHAERLIVAMGQHLDADVVKIGHHGSATSSIQSFVGAVSAEVAVVSAGENNRYGHPSEKIIHRWEDAGTQVYRTDQNGAVTLNVIDGKLNVVPVLK